MKVLAYYGPKSLKVEEMPNMEMNQGCVRIKSLYSGISHGTEMSVYRGVAPFYTKVQDWQTKLFVEAPKGNTWNYPVRSTDPGVWYMGYSLVGEIVEKANDVTDLEIGDKVYVNAPHTSEVVKPASACIKLPKNIKTENAVIFTNLMTAYNGILDSRIKLGDVVVVSGLGVLGQLVIQMAKMSGAAVIGIDVIDERLKQAKEYGADYVFSSVKSKDVALEVKAVTQNRGADLVIEVSGNQKALHQAIRMAGYDGVVTCLGWYQGDCSAINLSEEFHHNRVSLRSSQTCGIDPSISNLWNDKRKTDTCVELLGKLKLDNLITNIISFEQADEAYKLVDTKPEEVIQTVLKY
jgi:threonine dehydrogenase-like Zn-dependent dehydrogenase